jgi:hypothetical protein
LVRRLQRRPLARDSPSKRHASAESSGSADSPVLQFHGGIRLYLISTQTAMQLGDGRDGVTAPLHALGAESRLLVPLAGGTPLRVAILMVRPGRYTLAYWCRACHGLLGAIWPNQSTSAGLGYATLAAREWAPRLVSSEAPVSTGSPALSSSVSRAFSKAVSAADPRRRGRGDGDQLGAPGRRWGRRRSPAPPALAASSVLWRA